jgi:hypothetical protein
MKLSEAPGMLKRLRHTPWKFQQTFHTPLKNLPAFAGTIVSSNPALHACSIVIGQVVFEPKHLLALLARHSIPASPLEGQSIAADTRQEAWDLLQVALSDWIDFFFVPEPKSFVVFADHDEYTTMYAHTRSNLNRVTKTLVGQGFTAIQGYERKF